MIDINTTFSQKYQYGVNTILGQLDPSALELVMNRASTLHFRRSKIVVTEETENTNLFFVLAGCVRAGYISKDGREVSLADIGPGDCFGEFSVIDGHSTSASVVAIEDCQVALLSRGDFVALLAESQSFVHVMLRHLVAKIRQRTTRIIEFSSLPVGHRVRAELLRLAVPVSGRNDEGVIVNPPTQGELATYISSHREAVAREMAELTRSGALVKEGRKIVIRSLSALRTSIIGLG
jgi:CRP/FNR family transcriptional regulator, cyclic AMP receptor protein